MSRRRVKAYLDNLLAQARPGERHADRALSRHAARFARRQRLRAALRRYFRHPRPARPRRRRRGGRRGDGARDRPHHRPPRLAARRTGAARQAVQPASPTQLLERPDQGEEYAARTKLTVARFSREQEFEADRIGIRTIAKAGYDPYAAARFLDKLGRWSALHAGGGGRQRQARHDGDASLDARAHRRGGRAGQADRRQGHRRRRARQPISPPSTASPSATIPRRGWRSRTLFVHPKLGFAFRAPEGFALENQTRGADRRRRGRHAGAAARQHRRRRRRKRWSRRSASGWIDGVQTNSIETLKDTDLPTAIAVAKGDQWTFRLAAIRLGDAHLPADLRRAYAERAGRRALPGRDPLVPPHHGGGERDGAAGAYSYRRPRSPATTPRRSPGAWRRSSEPEETFLILNGLERGSPTPVGAALQGGRRRDAHRKLEGRVVAATHNKGKLAELRDLLEPAGRRRWSAPANSACPSRRRPATRSSPTRSSRRARRRERSGLPAHLRRFRPLRRRARRRAGHLFRALGGGGGKDFGPAMARIEAELRARAARRSRGGRGSSARWRSPGPTAMSRRSRAASTAISCFRRAGRAASATTPVSCPTATRAPSAR